MQLTKEVRELADRFFEQLRALGASEELIRDLAMTIVRHAERDSIVIELRPLRPDDLDLRD